MIHISDSSLSPTEREDEKVESLIDKEPAPSRKHTERRGPKYDNRKRRIVEDDDDLGINTVEGDKDLSLNYKSSSFSLSTILRVALDIDKLQESVRGFYEDLNSISPALGRSFSKYAKKYYKAGKQSKANSLVKEIKEDRRSIKSISRNYLSDFKRYDAESISNIIANDWPEADEFAHRAAIINALKLAIDSISLPQSLKIPFIRDNYRDIINSKKFINEIIESSKKTSKKSKTKFDEDDIVKFAQLASAYRVVSSNPDSIDYEDLTRNIEDLSTTIKNQYDELSILDDLMSDWHQAMTYFSSPSDKETQLGKSSKDYDAIIESIDGFLNGPTKIVDIDSYSSAMKDYAKEVYGEIPDEMNQIFRAATSNEKGLDGNMTTRVSTYHGVDEQPGNPVDPTNTGYKSYDRRFFSMDHYKSILKSAGDILDEDWFKSGWEGGAEEARFRAALDLAIHTADNNLYQSKIDSETYDLLLNKLAKWGHDTFLDTVIPFKKTAGTDGRISMRPELQMMVKVANDLRGSNPVASLEIMKNVRALATDRTAEEIVEFKSMGDEDFDKLKKEVEKDSKKMFDAQDVEDLLAMLDEINMDVEEKVGTSMGRAASVLFSSPRLAASRPLSGVKLEDLSRKIQTRISSILKFDDPKKFIAGFRILSKEIQDIISKKVGASVALSDLVKYAHANPESRSVLLPIIISARDSHLARAKKSKDKTSKSKKVDKDKAKKAEKVSKSDKKSKTSKRSKKPSMTASDLSW